MNEPRIAKISAEDACDVLVIGGGPAGSTAAALLAERGWDVVLCDKDRHPRFHIGESLLPMNMPILRRLGVFDQVAAIGVRKNGVDFTSATHASGTLMSYFADALNCTESYAFHVRRAEFDHLLLKNCAAHGVRVHEGVSVDDVAFGRAEDHVVSAGAADGARLEWTARFVVDASGRDTFLSRRLGLRRRSRKHQSAAVFGHFEGVARRAGRDEGNISIYWFEHGWFWLIPLRGNVFSVGAVCWPEYLKTRRTDMATFLWDTIALCPGAAERMRGAALLGEATATGNYSYSSTRMHGDGYLLLGDAFAFVDPVFSSGVYLAMHSAELGAEAVDARLRGAPEAARLLRRMDRRMRRGLNVFKWFIYRFTSPGIHNLFMSPRNPFRLRQAVGQVFAGDVFERRRIGWRIALFKCMYLVTAAAAAARTWTGYRKRRRNARLPVTDAGAASNAP